jgi:SAM-dependent methyltransferase
MSGDERETRWSKIGGVSGEEYAERFEALARSGADMHGEARFCSGLLDRRALVLDAGCGTGRVAVHLDELGYHPVGVDLDASMLDVARQAAPHLPWYQADLSSLTSEDVGGLAEFDLVVMAGNIVPLLAEGTVPAAVASLAALLAPEGLLVAGFGLDPKHLPPRCPVTPLEVYDEACRSAGLTLRERYSTWDRDPFDPATGYAVSVHALA